jgi:hypothetical protein
MEYGTNGRFARPEPVIRAKIKLQLLIDIAGMVNTSRRFRPPFAAFCDVSYRPTSRFGLTIITKVNFKLDLYVNLSF